jgi:hypothetical protein
LNGVIAALGRRIDASLLAAVVKDADLARVALALDHLADQAKVVGRNARPYLPSVPLYVPGSTRIVSPGAATSTAAWMDSPG